MSQYDVIIVGGGVVGLTAALGLASCFSKIALLEARPEIIAQGASDEGRAYAINQASKQLLEELALWPLIAEKDQSAYQKMFVWDSQTQAEIAFDARLIKGSELGFILSESVLKTALLKKIAEVPQIEIFLNAKIEAITEGEDSIQARSQDQEWQGLCLLIADGAQSQARQLLKVPIVRSSYHQYALTTRVALEKPHQKTAWQVFNAYGPLAFLPLKDEHQCAIVWSTTEARARALKELEEEAFNEAIAKAFEHKLGEVKLLNKRQIFPLEMQQAKQYVGKNWLLAGDAAHSIHPLAGLGLNMGLADIACCLALLKASQKPQFRSKILGAYQRSRKASVWQSILLLDAIKALFANPLGPVKRIRAFGLNFCNHLDPLKRMFIEHASGKS